jgi:hypothetical protein
MAASAGFEVSGQGGERSARVGLFGLYDPEDGRAYTSTLALALAMGGDSREETQIDLTGLLSRIIGDNQGVFPPLVYIYVELKRTQSPDIIIEGNIHAWGTGEEEFIIVD